MTEVESCSECGQQTSGFCSKECTIIHLREQLSQPQRRMRFYRFQAVVFLASFRARGKETTPLDHSKAWTELERAYRDHEERSSYGKSVHQGEVI